MPDTYVVAGRKPWNRRVFDERLAHLPGDWHYVATPDQLSSAVSEHRAQCVFFLHWSWIVPPEILESARCINFHMTDVPYGRGGSPLQNLILRGHRTTQLTALEMTDELDAGPVLLKENLDLGGTAEDVLVRSSELAAQMVIRILEENPQPEPQSGDVTVFQRRGAGDSELPSKTGLRDVHDHIRMLDAEGYPPAFVRYGDLRLELRRAAFYDGKVVADVEITIDREDDA